MKKILILGLLCSVIACDQNKKIEDELFKEVMDIHDEVMPQMGTLRSLSEKIQVQIDSIQTDSLESELQSKSEMEKLVKDLEEANESMMEWMRQFEQLEEGTPHGEVMQYLKEQKEAIEKVRDNMLAARKQGEYYLSEN